MIVIARGGGALEDLLPFSNEELIRAVAAAATPVVSAIGHEADRPILDDVADLRASTPTDAAKRIVPDVAEELAAGAPGAGPAAPWRRPAGGPGNRPAGLVALPSGAGLPRGHGHHPARGRRTAQGPLAGGGHDRRSSRAADQLVHLKAQVPALSPQKTLDRGYAVVQLAGAGRLPGSAGTSSGTPTRRRRAPT